MPATYKSNLQLRSPFLESSDHLLKNQHSFFVVWSDLHRSNSWRSSKWRILFFQRSNSFRPTERFFPNDFMRNHLFYRCYYWRCVEEQFVNVNTRRDLWAWFTNRWFMNRWEKSCVFFRRPHSRCTNSLNGTTRTRRSLWGFTNSLRRVTSRSVSLCKRGLEG